jgi:hypothetical protein
MREFFNRSCSDGKVAWDVVHNVIHIWRTYMPTGKEEYLDTVKVSLDLRGRRSSTRARHGPWPSTRTGLSLGTGWALFTRLPVRA